MIIKENNLTKEQMDKLKKFLDDNNISCVSSVGEEHYYHKVAKSEYINSVDNMNDYNKVILNLLVLAACGGKAPEFTFRAEVIQAFDGKKDYNEFANYNLDWDDPNADRGMNAINAIESSLYNWLSFDADPLKEDDEFVAINEFENFIKVF